MATGFEWNEAIQQMQEDRERATSEAGCNCDMRTKLVGDGCSKCNPDMKGQIDSGNAFDDWFDNGGYAEEHRDMFKMAWDAAVAWARRD